jgi:hypothetical protein
MATGEPVIVELYPQTFVTSASPDRFNAIITQASKARFTIAHEGYARLNGMHIYAVEFTDLDDRDRARIAMRFVDKDLAQRSAAAAPATRAARA